MNYWRTPTGSEGTPANDPTGTVRIAPGEDPQDTNSERVFKVDHRWIGWTGHARGSEWTAEGFPYTEWPIQPREVWEDVDRRVRDPYS